MEKMKKVTIEVSEEDIPKFREIMEREFKINPLGFDLNELSHPDSRWLFTDDQAMAAGFYNNAFMFVDDDKDGSFYLSLDYNWEIEGNYLTPGRK